MPSNIRALARRLLRRADEPKVDHSSEPTSVEPTAIDPALHEIDKSDFNKIPPPPPRRLFFTDLRGSEDTLRRALPRIQALPEGERAAAREEASRALGQEHPAGFSTWAELELCAQKYDAAKFPG